MTSLLEKAHEIAKEFEVNDEQINQCVKYFVESAEEGLTEPTDRGMPMLPTYVTAIPNGTEKGTLLAVDLGGTNLRVCSTCLHGDGTFDLVQEKEHIPSNLMIGDSKDFFGFMADRVAAFLKKHHDLEKSYGRETGHEALASNPTTPNLYKLGFTFSFPVDQTALNRGKLIRWTKGFDIKDAVGKDICEMFQKALNERFLPVYVAALVNDTVGTLMARSYTKSNDGQTLIGCIFGTGTNGAYSEKISRIKKFDRNAHPEITSNIMIVNTEWGSFDNDLKHLSNTRFDRLLNDLTHNASYHMFEKRISGMFLGELLRLVLVEFKETHQIFTDEEISADTALYTPWSTDTSIPSRIDGDETPELTETQEVIKQLYGQETTLIERQAIQVVVRAIGTRSARLSAVPIAGIILRTGALHKFKGDIDIGADGAVVEHYPNFESRLRKALRATQVGEGENRVKIGIAKDGSGVGAALCALVAE